MTDKQFYDAIETIICNNLQWQIPYKAKEISERLATALCDFLFKYKKTITYIDLDDGNDR